MWDNTVLNLQTVKDIILIIGSLIGTFFTFVSINKWKKEHKGKLKYELSRNVLKASYALRDDFYGVRTPMIFASEYLPTYDFKKKMDTENYQYVFSNRLKSIQPSYNVFLSLLPEVELEFGKEIKDLCRELISRVNIYHMRVNEFVQLTDDTNNDDYYKEVKNIVFFHGENDAIEIEFESAIKKIEDAIYLRIKK